MEQTAFWILTPLLWVGVACFWRSIYKDMSTGKADPVFGGIMMTVSGCIALIGTLSTATAIWGQP